jgi:hypothetical protein
VSEHVIGEREFTDGCDSRFTSWLAVNPIRLLADNFRLSDAVVEKLPQHRVFNAGKGGPGA